jgi:hypothetical protein
MRTIGKLSLATLILLALADPGAAQCTSPTNEDCDGATAFTFDQLPLDVSARLGCTNDMVDRPYFDVFYRYDCTVSGEYRFDMCGSLGDTYMRIYIDGCGFGPATSWVEDDDGCGAGPDHIDPLITMTLEAGTSYWIELGAWREDDFFPPNAGDPYVFHVEFLDGPWTDLGGGTAGSNGTPNLVGTGPLTPGSSMSLDLTAAPPFATTLLWLSLSSAPQSFFGGTIHPLPPTTEFLLACDGAGALSLGGTWPSGVPAATDIWFQYLVGDPSVPPQITLSNGVQATTP